MPEEAKSFTSGDMESSNPFSQERLNRIFTFSPKHPDRIVSRESGWLEFKESFGFQSLGKYIRSAGAFANANGGYIVYGVANSPHILVGLKDDSFDKLDPEKLTGFLNEHFDPALEWDRHVYELDGKHFGLLYFFESRNKPVICRKGTDDGKALKEGEIYCRYKGRTQTIRYAELKELIDERRQREQLLWFKHLKEIARIGIHEAGILDLQSGKVSGTGGHFFIDENLLSQISFIREGEFDEQKGKPALKLIGDMRPVTGHSLTKGGPKTRIVRTKGIRCSDIMLAFLNSEKVDEPKSYLTQICYENSAFFPFYFLLKQARMNLAEANSIVSAEPSTQPAKGKFMKRLQDDAGLKLPMPFAGTESGQRKLKARALILAKKIPVSSDEKTIKFILQMIRTLEASELDEAYLKKQLAKWFNQHYAQANMDLNHDLRRTISFLDWRLNSPPVSKKQ